MQVNSFRSIPMYKPETPVTDTKDVGFAEKMAEASDDAAINALAKELEQKYGIKITVADAKSGDKAYADSIENATGHGNVVIAPNIMKEMLNSPAKKAEIEKILRDHKGWLSYAQQESGTVGKSVVNSGLIIQADGRYSEWGVEGASADGAMLDKLKDDSEIEDEWWLHIRENIDREREIRELMMEKQDEDTQDVATELLD